MVVNSILFVNQNIRGKWATRFTCAKAVVVHSMQRLSSAGVLEDSRPNSAYRSISLWDSLLGEHDRGGAAGRGQLVPPAVMERAH
jgi:hypothetical protein